MWGTSWGEVEAPVDHVEYWKLSHEVRAPFVNKTQFLYLVFLGGEAKEC